MSVRDPGNWWDAADVRVAFEAWRAVQEEITGLQQGATADDLAHLDARSRDAQNRALQAWHMYEMERENAGGPLAGQV